MDKKDAKRKHILIIDDDYMMRQIFGAKLNKAGYEVIYATGGDEGREMARKFIPDLILLDIRMPNTDGYTVAKRLRADRFTKNIRIVFLTNVDMSRDAKKYMKEVYVDDFFHKSMDLDELVDKVKLLLAD